MLNIIFIFSQKSLIRFCFQVVKQSCHVVKYYSHISNPMLSYQAIKPIQTTLFSTSFNPLKEITAFTNINA